MLKLKEIIAQLDEITYQKIEGDFLKNKAKNSLYLLEGLRNGTKNEKEICTDLELSNTAFYALKSRLLDKIQDNLPKLETYNKEELISTLSRIPQICSTNPRETANAILQKLEVDLIEQGMHNELIHVYSALKKINIHSNKYFNYSQQYNKQLAYMMSREKTDEISCEFSKFAADYYLSKDKKTAEALQFLLLKIDNVYELNQSRLTLLTKNILHIQYHLFCSPDEEFEILPLLIQCDEIIQELKSDNWSQSYRIFTDFLYFEYYVSVKKLKSAESYFSKVKDNVETILLNNFIGSSISFLCTSLYYLQVTNPKAPFENNTTLILIDNDHNNATIAVRFYEAVIAFKSGENKKARQLLLKTINDFSFVNFFKAEIEFKLFLSFLLILEKEIDMADDYLKKILRKIKSTNIETFFHVEYLIKLFDQIINKEPNSKNDLKKKEYFALFKASNVGQKEILKAIVPLIEEEYSL